MYHLVVGNWALSGLYIEIVHEDDTWKDASRFERLSAPSWLVKRISWNLRTGGSEREDVRIPTVFENSEGIFPAGDEKGQHHCNEVHSKGCEHGQNEETELNEVRANVLAGHHRVSHHETHGEWSYPEKGKGIQCKKGLLWLHELWAEL